MQNSPVYDLVASASTFEELEVAKAKAYFVKDIYQNLVKSCFDKCIVLVYRNPETHPGELVCSDRCVKKFFNAHAYTRQIIDEFNKEQEQNQ
ncbi:hypothetical protein ABK040_009248 [Willaertia magna]